MKLNKKFVGFISVIMCMVMVFSAAACNAHVHVYDTTHKCTDCGYQGEHSYTVSVRIESTETHNKTCTGCGNVVTENCSGGNATCSSAAICTGCLVVYGGVDSSAHNVVGGVCEDCEQTAYVRYNSSNEPTANGEFITLGSYPQTHVTDNTLVGELKTAAGDVPTTSDSKGWTNYGYYISSSNATPYMWYKDITHTDNNTYRGIYFRNYRPTYTHHSEPANTSSVQYKAGYTKSTSSIARIYWFKFEPIKWRILEENGGKALLLSQLIIDGQTMNSSADNKTVESNTVYANNYEYSEIRSWLNADFYNVAFNALQKASIATTLVDNSLATAGTKPDGTNGYLCANTEDKVFLPSLADIINTNYGFNSDPLVNDTARIIVSTDYANAQGLVRWSDPNASYLWTRSPNPWTYDSFNQCRNDGITDECANVNQVQGICPMMYINL